MKHLVPINTDKKNISYTSSAPIRYVPRDYFTNPKLAIEDAVGHDKYDEILYHAGYKSAYHWCEKEAESTQLNGIAVFEHYLKCLSQRGWGKFSVVSIDTTTGNAEIKLHYSSFVLAQPRKPGKFCNLFASWFAGAMDWATQRKGHSIRTNCESVDCTTNYCSESECAGSSQSYCIFTIKPSAVESKPV